VAAWLLAAAWQAATAAPPAAPRAERTQWVCDLVYLPMRSSWQRQLWWDTERSADGRRAALRRLHIDGQPVHTFNLEGSLLLTSMDNERIAIDLRSRQWQSDLRGLASARGTCRLAATPSP
jgi:hypothetical protein